MIKLLRPCIAIIVALLCQVTILPAFIADPFRPNLLLVMVVWFSLTLPQSPGAVLIYLLGLVQDCVNGLYFGLYGFTYLLTFMVLHSISHHLYTGSRYLMTLAVFVATIASGVSHLVLLALFSSAEGLFATLISSLLPQGLVNALAASLMFGFLEGSRPEEDT